MVQQITHGIKISVKTGFSGTYNRGYKLFFAFSYEITIENKSNDSVQLLSRHWDIFDASGIFETVEGDGVVGKKPVLKSGEKHSYRSACHLTSPIGAMKGFYNMVNFSTTRMFKVKIPTFQLCVPFVLS